MAPRFSLVCYSVTQCPRFCFAAVPGGVSGAELNGLVLAGIRCPVRSGLLVLSLVHSCGVGQVGVMFGSLNCGMGDLRRLPGFGGRRTPGQDFSWQTATRCAQTYRFALKNPAPAYVDRGPGGAAFRELPCLMGTSENLFLCEGENAFCGAVSQASSFGEGVVVGHVTF